MIGHVWGDEESGRTFSVSAGWETVAVGYQLRRFDDETGFVLLLGPLALVWWRERNVLHVHVPPIDWCYAPDGWHFTGMNPGDTEKPTAVCASCGYVRVSDGQPAVPHPPASLPVLCHAPDGWTEREGLVFECNTCHGRTYGWIAEVPHPRGRP